MNNLLSLQKTLLESFTLNPVVYVIGNHADVAELANFSRVIYYSPDRLERDSVRDMKLENVEVLDEVKTPECYLLIIDLHFKGLQAGYELATIKAFHDITSKYNPFVFIRAEDVDQSFLLVQYLKNINYKPFFWFKIEEQHQVWIFSYSKKIIVPDFGLQDAFDSGHPKTPRPEETSISGEAVEYIIK